MARQETDRDDLWAEARALSPRVEFRATSFQEPIIAGFRDAIGGWSIYFGGDPVYHFDDRGRLRRAFVAGDLYRSQGSTLARLVRRRTPRETQLLRGHLADCERDAFVCALRTRLELLRAAGRRHEAVVLRQQGQMTDAVATVMAAIDTILDAPQPLAPALPTRR